MTLMMALNNVPVGEQFQEVLEILDELGEAGDRLLRAIDDAKLAIYGEGASYVPKSS